MGTLSTVSYAPVCAAEQKTTIFPAQISTFLRRILSCLKHLTKNQHARNVLKHCLDADQREIKVVSIKAGFEGGTSHLSFDSKQRMKVLEG